MGQIGYFVPQNVFLMKKIINVVDDDDVVRYACFGRVIMSGRALFESRELAEDNPRLGRTDLETVSRKQS